MLIIRGDIIRGAALIGTKKTTEFFINHLNPTIKKLEKSNQGCGEIYQKKSWLRMKSLSSKLGSRSVPRGDDEGRMASAAPESKRFWKREELEEDNFDDVGNDNWWLSPS